MAYEVLSQLFEPPVRNKIRQVKGEEYLPHRPPFIFAVNHTGFIDGPVLTVFFRQKRKINIYYPTTEVMWRFWGSYLAKHWIHMIPIYNKQKIVSLDEAIRILKEGNVIGIFPEGKRNADSNNLLKGKTGAVRLALATGAPLIPVGLVHNTGNGFWQAFLSLWQGDKAVDISIGPAVSLAEFTNRLADKPLLEAATRKLMNAIGRLCGKNYPY